MIYITIIDHRLLCFAETFIISDLTFKIKPFRARERLWKAYHRFCLTDLSKFLPSQGVQNSLIFLFLLDTLLNLANKVTGN